MIMENKDLITVKQAHKEFPDFSTQKICYNIRAKKLSAKKIGRKYYIDRTVLYKFLGLETTKEEEKDLKKDLLIAQLKAEIAQYKQKLLALQAILNTCGDLQ